MSEPQYQEYFNYPKEKLGVMASQYWRDDPKLLGIHLARYKFVSKMLAGKKRVAEVGCGDGWFSMVVAKEVGELHLYDFDKRFIDGIYSAGGDKAYVHNILDGKLEYGKYDGIYSLDVMEHIEPSKTQVYLENICDSLNDHGVAIIGQPSLESQKYASPASKIGHVSCMNGGDLKRVLEAYFHQVFVMGYNDEMLHVGHYGMRHYNIAICTGLK